MKTTFKWEIRKLLLRCFDHRVMGGALRTVDDGFDRCFRGPLRILFVIRNNVGFAFQLPLIRQMVNDDRFQISYTLDTRGIDIELPEDFNQPNTKYKFIHQNKVIFHKWDYVIHTAWPSLKFQRTTKQVYLPHGLAFGNKDYSVEIASHPNIDIYLGLSKNEKQFIESRVPNFYESTKQLFLSAGSPLLNSLLKKEDWKNEIEEVVQRYPIKPEKKKILIASTWGHESLYKQLGTWWIEKLAKKPNIEILITGHEFLWYGRNRTKPGPVVGLEDRLKTISSRHKNITFLKEPIWPLLYVSDLLICDHSSILPAYCFLKKPILFYDSPEYQFSDPLAYEHYMSASFPFDSIKTLAKQFEILDSSRLEAQERLCDYFIAHQKNAVDQIKDLFITLGRTSKITNEKWSMVKKISENHSVKKHDQGVFAK